MTTKTEPKTRTGGLLDFFRQAKSTVGELQAQLRHLADEIEARKQEREDLQSLPLTREDATARLHDWIDQQASEYPSVVLKHSRAMIHDNPQQTRAHDIVAMLINPLGSGINSRAMAWLFNAQIKDRVAAALAEMEWPDQVGPALAERRKRIAELDEQIPVLEAELTELMQQAEQAGFRVERVKPPTRKADRPGALQGGTPLVGN